MKRYSENTFYQYRDWIVLLIVIVVSLVLIAVHDQPIIESLKEPFLKAGLSMQSRVAWIPRVRGIQAENNRLMEEIGKLMLERERVREALAENSRLRQMLGLKNRPEFQFTAAEVIGLGAKGMPGAVHLNAGAKDGCVPGQPLLTDRGVAGRLVHVSPSQSVGQLFADPNSRISAKVQRSRVLGIARWLYGNMCVLEGVPQRSDVLPGDRIITSGYSRHYPKGLPVARVIEVKSDPDELFMRITCRTEVSFETLETVLILKHFEDSAAAEIWE